MIICELSGEVVLDDGVVTPSGHVCSRRILVQKLDENGGLDPFTEATLSTDDLITLQTTTKVPPKTASSFSSMVKQLQEEYDAVLLELIDTRAALQETRQELSTALYQNDAAIRVIARLSAERDAARSSEVEQPPEKKRKIVAKAKKQDLSEADLDEMQAAWESLKASRKSRQKEATALAWSAEQQANLVAVPPTLELDSPRDIAHCGLLMAGCGKSQMCIYNVKEEKLVESVDVSLFTIDINETYIAGGSDSGEMTIWTYKSGIAKFAYKTLDQSIIHVQLHPDNIHALAMTHDGAIYIVRLGDTLPVVGVFVNEDTTATAGELHPDGLIYLVGTSLGSLLIWDLKNQSLAGTMGGGAPIIDVAFSSNGYHIAAAHENGVVVVWDLRKQKEVTRIVAANVSSVCFDATGKHLAYVHKDGFTVATVKQWESKVLIAASGLQKMNWGESWISATTSAAVNFFQPKTSS